MTHVSSSMLVITLIAGAACGPAPRPAETDPGADGQACDPQHCAAGETCCGAACSSDPSCAFALTGMSESGGFIGGGSYVRLFGTGFARGLRAYIGTGRAPVRVVSSTEAVIVTPPAIAGRYDVRVELDELTASLPAAFDYYTGDFTDTWVRIAMNTARGNFPAITTLQDGRVLIAGGSDGTDPNALSSAELYDPVLRATVPTASPMLVPRYTATAITLLDGRALIVGVCNSPSSNACLQHGNRAVAELFDPAGNTFTALASRMVDPTRVYPTPVLLPDGRVLIQSLNNRTAELFDPETDTFTLLPAVSQLAALGRPTRLRDGRVAFLSADGIEVLDSDTGTFAAVPAPGIASGAVAAFTLPDGRVIAPGGVLADPTDFVPTAQITVFDPASASVQFLPQPLTSPRLKFGSALLRDGSVMIAAGVDDAYPQSWWCSGFTFPTTATVDRIDPIAGTVTTFAPLPDTNMELVATTMLDGSILVGGGAPCGGAGAYPYLYFLESAPIL